MSDLSVDDYFSSKRLIRQFLLSIYAANYGFWNKATASHLHEIFKDIFSYGIKAICR